MWVSPNETFQTQVDKRRVKKRSTKQEMKYLDKELLCAPADNDVSRQFSSYYVCYGVSDEINNKN